MDIYKTNRYNTMFYLINALIDKILFILRIITLIFLILKIFQIDKILLK